MRRLVMVSALCFAVAAPALAADPVVPDPGAKAAKAKDPNEIVCEYQEQLGSRLAGHKVCATRFEWAQRRQDDRMGIERGQLLRVSQGR